MKQKDLRSDSWNHRGFSPVRMSIGTPITRQGTGAAKPQAQDILTYLDPLYMPNVIAHGQPIARSGAVETASREKAIKVRVPDD
jgi:hypothetical protein